MDLNRREQAVLCAIVDLHIRTGEAVASRRVAEEAGVSLSPATIRSVVSRLEEGGYVTREHSSAGSIPTDQAVRLYVETVGVGRSLPGVLRRKVRERIGSQRRELVEDFAWVARLTADLTREAGMAVRPMGEQPSLVAVSFARLGESRALGLVVTSDGTLEKRVLDLPDDCGDAVLQEVETRLNERCRGLSLDQIRDEILEGGGGGSVFAGARPAGELARKLLATSSDEVEVLVAGTENLLMSEEFAQVERLRSLLRVLEDHDRIAREWRRGFRVGTTQVIIGEESDVTASGSLAMVATLFFREGRRAGAVGVVGPRRMDYGRIVPMVSFIGNALTETLNGSGATHA